MLSAKILNEKEIYEICQHSADISVNDRFKGALFFSAQQEDEYLSQTTVICIGKIDNTERIFRTEDKLCYFGVSVGVPHGFVSHMSFASKISLIKKFCQF